MKYPFTQFKQIYIFLKICTAIDIWTSTNKHQMYYNHLIKKLFEKEKILCEINYLNVNSALSQLLFSSHSILHHIVGWPFFRITFNSSLYFLCFIQIKAFAIPSLQALFPRVWELNDWQTCFLQKIFAISKQLWWWPMSPVVQLVIELMVMIVMITWRMITWVSSCLDPSEASVSQTQESVAHRATHSREVMTDTGCKRHDCQVLKSILNLSRESHSLLKVLVSLRKNPRGELGEADNDVSGDEASGDEASWVSWVNVITFLRDKTDRKSLYIPAIFSSESLKHELRYQGWITNRSSLISVLANFTHDGEMLKCEITCCQTETSYRHSTSALPSYTDHPELIGVRDSLHQSGTDGNPYLKFCIKVLFIKVFLKEGPRVFQGIWQCQICFALIHSV